MKKPVKVISAMIFLLCPVLAALFLIPVVTGKKILIGHVSGSQFIYGIIAIILFLAVLFAIVRYRYVKCVKNLIIMISVSVISVAALLITSFFYLLFMADSATYYTFYSPDGNYCVVAEEWSWLLAGHITLYERINPFLVEKKAVLTTDDGFRAIAADAYEIQWDNNVVTFTIETTDWDRRTDTAVVAMKIYE